MATTTTLQVDFRAVDHVRIRYADSGGSQEPTILLTSPWPKSGVPDEIRADYLDCYDGDRFVDSMRYVRGYPEELPQLAELLPEIATPVKIINGRHDPVVPVGNAEFLDQRLPNSRVVLIDAGRFVWEEAPAEYASIVLDSVIGPGVGGTP